MVVQHPPKWPEFGAVETKLRYDAPISVCGTDGKYSSMNYDTAWDPKLQDVVVILPNGSRFVFWRGSCYIPFWASRHNTGFCYEWAERKPPADARDAVEPLMDKGLRYGRVRIIESTAARVHVRWTYQSCDMNYKVWGDSAAEDFYFYPDGFGTRVLTLQSSPGANYEVSELIILTSQSAYPLSVIPPNLVDFLFVDGQKRELRCPIYDGKAELVKSRNMPVIYRVRMHKDEPMAAIYYSPADKDLPNEPWSPFVDHGQPVTHVYWGHHWPLSRGHFPGNYIADDRLVRLTPCHNSIMTWGYYHRPTPLRTADVTTLDSLGRAKSMVRRTFVWLVGMSGADDSRLLQWAHSFSTPSSVEVQGARLDAEPYVPERRAIRLIVEDKIVTVAMRPSAPCVNPVFEFSSAPRKLVGVQLTDRLLDAKEFAWDGNTLWLNATITQAATLRLEFAE